VTQPHTASPAKAHMARALGLIKSVPAVSKMLLPLTTSHGVCIFNIGLRFVLFLFNYKFFLITMFFFRGIQRLHMQMSPTRMPPAWTVPGQLAGEVKTGNKLRYAYLFFAANFPLALPLTTFHGLSCGLYLYRIIIRCFCKVFSTNNFATSHDISRPLVRSMLID
jgi:hypothetical protein